MSKRIVVSDASGKGFQVEPAAARRFLDDGFAVVVLATDDGELADATVLRPVAGKTADELRLLAGASALSPLYRVAP